jgi:Fe-S cluster biogenesis protein NfuA
MIDTKKIEKVLDEIRPSLQADGGDVEFVEVTQDGLVKVKLTGACHGCPMAEITLHQGIETYLKKQIPEIEGVEKVD